MSPLPELLRTPPSSFKVYAPDGTTAKYQGHLVINETAQKLLIVDASGCLLATLNKKVVVYDLGEKGILWNPRFIQQHQPDFLSREEHRWLHQNPQWPAILELEDRGTKNSEGLFDE
jgi:hypothetical protein